MTDETKTLIEMWQEIQSLRNQQLADAKKIADLQRTIDYIKKDNEVLQQKLKESK
jgi:hypothetical protein